MGFNTKYYFINLLHFRFQNVIQFPYFNNIIYFVNINILFKICAFLF